MNPGFYALVGPNAAGKTHYLHTLMSPHAAFVPAGADAKFAGTTVDDHLRAVAAIYPHVRLEFPNARIRDLSVGQRRLLTIEVALAIGKDLLLLDEPFDGIDTTTRKQVRQRLIDYIAENPQRSVVMASQSRRGLRRFGHPCHADIRSRGLAPSPTRRRPPMLSNGHRPHRRDQRPYRPLPRRRDGEPRPHDTRDVRRTYRRGRCPLAHRVPGRCRTH